MPEMHPSDQIQVVAGLGHEHRRLTVRLLAPLAAHKTDGHVMVGDMLHRLDVEQVTDDTIGYLLPNGGIEGGVAQYVTDRHVPLVVSCRLDQLPHFIHAGGKGLFQQQMIACLEQRQGCGHMLMVHGAIDGDVSKARHGGQFSGRNEATLGWQCIFAAHEITTPFDTVGDADDPQLLRMGLGVGGVGQGAVAGADDHSIERTVRHLQFPG